jgi:hypothetical protein
MPYVVLDYEEPLHGTLSSALSHAAMPHAGLRVSWSLQVPLWHCEWGWMLLVRGLLRPALLQLSQAQTPAGESLQTHDHCVKQPASGLLKWAWLVVCIS